MSYSNSLFIVSDSEIDEEIAKKVMVVKNQLDALEKEKQSVSYSSEPKQAGYCFCGLAYVIPILCNCGVARTKQGHKKGYEIVWCWGNTHDIDIDKTNCCDECSPTFSEAVNNGCPVSCCICLMFNCAICICPERGFRDTVKNNVKTKTKIEDLDTKISACRTNINSINSEKPQIMLEKAKQKYAQMLTVRQDIARLVLAGSRDEAELATFDRKMALFKESYGVVTDKEREEALKRSNDAWNENYERQFGNKVKSKPVMSPYAARAYGAAIGNNIAQIISTID